MRIFLGRVETLSIVRCSNFTNLTFRAREFCINSIGEYEEKVKEIEELKKAQAQEEEAAEEDVEENAEDNEEVPEGEEQKEGKVEKLEGEPEEKKPKTSSSNASTLSIELKEKKSLRKVFYFDATNHVTHGGRCCHPPPL